MPHTRNPERLSHLPKVTQHQVCWCLGVTSLLCHSPAFEAESAHDGWIVSFYPRAVKVKTLGYQDPGIRVSGEAGMEGKVWGKRRKSRELKGLSGLLELAPCLSESLKVTQPRRDLGRRMASWGPVCPLEQGVLPSNELRGQRRVMG